MASVFTTITNGGVEVTLSAGFDAELEAVCEGPWSSQYAYDYCNEIAAYFDVENCKHGGTFSLTSRGPSISRIVVKPIGFAC
jgi:hypothetical protein